MDNDSDGLCGATWWETCVVALHAPARSWENEEIDHPMRRRDRGELGRHHEATDGAHPSTVLQLLGLHLEIATENLKLKPLANRTEDSPVFLGEPSPSVHVKTERISAPPGTGPLW